MKTITVFCLILITIIPIAFSEEKAIDPLAFIPPGFQREQTDEWIKIYSDEFISLAQKDNLSPKALHIGILFCRDAEFSSDPRLAAGMVHDLLVKTDFLLRSGRSLGEIKIKNGAAWQADFKDSAGNADLREEKLALKVIKKDMSILNGKKTTLPIDKAQAIGKIKEKVNGKIKEKVKKK
jgi:hypothetical protein